MGASLRASTGGDKAGARAEPPAAGVDHSGAAAAAVDRAGVDDGGAAAAAVDRTGVDDGGAAAAAVDRAGVVDKVAAILDALEAGPATLAELTAATELPRATAHRLAVALARHRLVGRGDDGRFVLGTRVIALGHAAADALPLRAVSTSALERLRDRTGEGVQLYVAEEGGRRCVLSLQSPHGLRWIVPEGALLPYDRGSAGRLLAGTASTTSGWVESVEEREPGVASVSAPVRGPSGVVLAAVSVSGPLERLSRSPGLRFGPDVVAAADEIGDALRRR